ncbi:MAG: ATP-binding protein [Anaerolineae bacterium]|nr:ATP-binding protein [Anaerolineae bacterium]
MNGTSALSQQATSPEPQDSPSFEMLKRQTDQLLAINNVITAAANSPGLEHTLNAALEAVLKVVPLDASGISLIDHETNELVMYAQRGWRRDFTTEPMRVKLGEGLSGLVINNGTPVITGDLSDEPRLQVKAFLEEHVKAMALLPMHARGRVVGVLSVMSRSPYNFSDSEVNILQVIADQVGLAIDNALLVESVRAQQQRLEAILHATGDAIIATDERGVINVVNHAARRLFGENSKLLGESLCEAAFLPAIRERLCNAIQLNATERNFEVLLSNKQYLLCEVAPIPANKQGAEPSWVVVFRDITHLKRAEQARLDFIQTAAHELRNPLSVTLSALHMLGKQWEDRLTESDREIFEIAFRGIGRMQDLIDDLLNLEHIESGVGMRFEPINVFEMVMRCANDMRPMLANKKQSLIVETQENIPPFMGDERWLTRALMNLISNAHKYTQEGGQIIVRAQHRTMQGKPELVLQVQDNGPGIPREAQRHLFDRFYRVRSVEDKTIGTGLGLAIVKSVVEQHKGRVTVYSELPLFSTLWQNKGTTFSIILPYRDRPDAEPLC